MAKVLIVEDEPQIVRALRLYLERAGYSTAAVHDGAQAVPAFRQEKPDLILLDLNLPNRDGVDICRAIRRDSGGADHHGDGAERGDGSTDWPGNWG